MTLNMPVWWCSNISQKLYYSHITSFEEKSFIKGISYDWPRKKHSIMAADWKQKKKNHNTLRILNVLSSFKIDRIQHKFIMDGHISMQLLMDRNFNWRQLDGINLCVRCPGTGSVDILLAACWKRSKYINNKLKASRICKKFVTLLNRRSKLQELWRFRWKTIRNFSLPFGEMVRDEVLALK